MGVNNCSITAWVHPQQAFVDVTCPSFNQTTGLDEKVEYINPPNALVITYLAGQALSLLSFPVAVGSTLLSGNYEMAKKVAKYSGGATAIGLSAMIGSYGVEKLREKVYLPVSQHQGVLKDYTDLQKRCKTEIGCAFAKWSVSQERAEKAVSYIEQIRNKTLSNCTQWELNEWWSNNCNNVYDAFSYNSVNFMEETLQAAEITDWKYKWNVTRPISFLDKLSPTWIYSSIKDFFQK